MDCVEQRRDKKKRELDRFSDAGEKRRQRRGDHDAADLGAIFLTCRVPNRECRCRQSPHFKQITARHVARGRIARNESRDFAVNHVARGRIGVITGFEKERNIPNVVQPKRDEGAFDNAIYGEGERGPLVHCPI